MEVRKNLLILISLHIFGFQKHLEATSALKFVKILLDYLLPCPVYLDAVWLIPVIQDVPSLMHDAFIQ